MRIIILRPNYQCINNSQYIFLNPSLRSFVTINVTGNEIDEQLYVIL